MKMIQPPQWKSKATGQRVLVADGWDSSHKYYVAVWLGEDMYMEKDPDVRINVSEFIEAFEKVEDDL